VLQPDDPERQEARDIGEIRLLVKDRAQQVVPGVRGYPQLEHEQRDRDREHTVLHGSAHRACRR
jgi:hypothetical protein